MRTEIDLPNPSERLYPGMYAEVSLELERHDDALTLPVSAIGSDANGVFVYAVQDSQVTRKSVKVGLPDGNRIEVIEGVSEDVAVLANAKTAPPVGTRVQVANTP
jgi:multidrug efflux pump subunit AcrA (membrane-fusion protein)